jgi:hypothetical protein
MKWGTYPMRYWITTLCTGKPFAIRPKGCFAAPDLPGDTQVETPDWWIVIPFRRSRDSGMETTQGFNRRHLDEDKC